jgi:hypothetical protein
MVLAGGSSYFFGFGFFGGGGGYTTESILFSFRFSKESKNFYTESKSKLEEDK